MSIANASLLDLILRETSAFRGFPWFTNIVLSNGSLIDLTRGALDKNPTIRMEEQAILMVCVFPE
jgi:hypothetical protein